MLDYQRTVDNIRSILASAGAASMESIWAVAVEYAEACEAVNDRLRKCGQLLREGLRSEAIQQSEADPNLLNLVATLDFPEATSWTALLQSNGLASPTPLLVEVASELNEAYAQEQPLAALLRRHRLQALGRSPLRDRIATVRKLAALDANNAVWQDDLRTYERARHQEIRSASDHAAKNGNAVALAELAHDVRSNDWLEPPAAGLVQQVSDAHKRVVRQRARTELEQLEPQLNDAFSQLDAAQGQALRTRWNHCAQLVDLSTDDALYERTAPALDWLDQQDQDAADEAGYQTAVAELERALDDEQGLTRLERRAHAVLRCERSIPPLLEQRLRTRMAALDLARSRQVRLIVAGAAAVVVLIGVGIGYAIFTHREGEQVAAHASTLQALMENYQFDEAQKHLDQLETSASSIAASADIQELGLELATRRREEEVRRESFLAAMEAAEKAGDEQPDRKSLEEARRLARLDSEKARVLKLEKTIAAVKSRHQAERDEAFLGHLKELNAQIDTLDRNSPDRKALAEVRKDLADLVTKSSGISAPVFNQSKVTQARIDSLYATIKRQRETEAAFEEIDRSVGDVDGFKRALGQFCERFPESSQAVDFKRVAAEAPLWKEVKIWNDFIGQWHKANLPHLDAARAKDLFDACNDMLGNHGGHPTAPELRRRISHLEPIIHRGEKPQASLIELFTDPLVAGLWMVEVTEKGTVSRYYLIAPPPKPLANQTSIRISYIADFSRKASTKKEIPLDVISFNGQAPQSVLAKFALDKIATLKPSWESAFVEIGGRIISDTHMDPILKVMFLQKVLDVACQGSESLRTAFTQFKEVLGSVPIDPAIPWMVPKNEDARSARLLAVDLLNRLPDFRRVSEQAAVDFKSFVSPLGQQYEWIGWLGRDTGGTWQGHLSTAMDIDRDLLVAQPTAGGKGLTWFPIGRVQAGKVKLGSGNPVVFVQGRPVFAIKANDK